MVSLCGTFIIRLGWFWLSGLVGGGANNGSNAGLANFNSTNSSGNVNANVSLRYFFFVFFLNFICDICSLPLGKR